MALGLWGGLSRKNLPGSHPSHVEREGTSFEENIDFIDSKEKEESIAKEFLYMRMLIQSSLSIIYRYIYDDITVEISELLQRTPCELQLKKRVSRLVHTDSRNGCRIRARIHSVSGGPPKTRR